MICGYQASFREHDKRSRSLQFGPGQRYHSVPRSGGAVGRRRPPTMPSWPRSRRRRESRNLVTGPKTIVGIERWSTPPSSRSASNSVTHFSGDGYNYDSTAIRQRYDHSTTYRIYHSVHAQLSEQTDIRKLHNPAPNTGILGGMERSVHPGRTLVCIVLLAYCSTNLVPLRLKRHFIVQSRPQEVAPCGRSLPDVHVYLMFTLMVTASFVHFRFLFSLHLDTSPAVLTADMTFR